MTVILVIRCIDGVCEGQLWRGRAVTNPRIVRVMRVMSTLGQVEVEDISPSDYHLYNVPFVNRTLTLAGFVRTYVPVPPKWEKPNRRDWRKRYMERHGSR